MRQISICFTVIADFIFNFVDPVSYLIGNFIPFQPKMRLNYLKNKIRKISINTELTSFSEIPLEGTHIFEARRRIAYLIEHRPSDSGLHNIGVIFA